MARSTPGGITPVRGATACGIGVLALVVLVVVVVARPSPVEAAWDPDCTDPTAVYDASTMPTGLDLDSGDRVLFSGGTFTGSVTTSGATICVDEPAAFEPSSINGFARLFVRGTATLPPLAAESGALLDNEGTVTFLAQPNTNGNIEVINRATGTIVVEGPGLALGPEVTAVNEGTIVVEGSVTLNGSDVTNDGDLSIGGTLTISGILTNTGTATVGGVLTVNGDGTLVNACSLVAGDLINNNTVSNDGVIDLGAGELRNNSGQAYDQGPDAVTLAGDLVNSGAVTGGGEYRFTGATLTEGSFVGDSADAPIIVFDTTPTGGPIFDVELGTIANVVRGEVTIPPPGSCSAAPPVTTTTTTSTTTTSTTTTSTTTTSTTTTSTTTTSTTTTTTEPTSPSSASSTSEPPSSALPTDVTRPPSSTPGGAGDGSDPGAGPGASGLARTGSSGADLLAGAGLVLVAVGLVVLARTREARARLRG